MRTLLTGAKGQLARCLRDRLPEDWELIATDSTSLDITDTEAVHHMIKNFQPDAIVNAAAYTAVDKAEENAEAAFAVNATAVHNLAETVDWMPKSRYVGVSGQKVRPDLYVAVGISGQMQHMAGARDARTIVAINSDGDAPIFAQADYGVVGDLHEVLPALTRALR